MNGQSIPTLQTISTNQAAPCRVVQLTGSGRSAIASLLVEGPSALEIVSRCFQSASRKPLAEHRINAIIFGRWGADGRGEELVVCRRSATRIELHCHGSSAAVEVIIESLERLGCQVQNWQAWISQTSDCPIASAAQIALASARTSRTAAILLDQWRGALRRELEQVIGLLEQTDSESTKSAVARLQNLQCRGALGLHLTKPWQVVLAGKVNVGKSSLINALVGYGRAIALDQPGTTRDVVTAETAIDGWPVELADTAGLRETEDPLEQQAVCRARQRADLADLVVLVLDASAAYSREDEELLAEYPQALVVRNKCDLPNSDLAGNESSNRPTGIPTSALTGAGIDELIKAIGTLLSGRQLLPGSAVPFTSMQLEAIQAAINAVSDDQFSEAISQLQNIAPAAES